MSPGEPSDLDRGMQVAFARPREASRAPAVLARESEGSSRVVYGSIA